MTVNADYVEKTYLCNGTTTTFSIPWKFFEDEIAVFKDKTFEIYPNTDYKIINNNDEGGEIIFNEAPGAGRYITIVRSIALYQYIKFLEGEDFPAHDYEYSLDRVYMALQMLKANVARCLQAPAGEDDFVSFVHKFLKMDYAGQGQTDWQSDYSYSMVELTRYYGYWWMSLTDNNKGNTPSSSSSFWTKFAICESYSKDELDERLAQKANTADVYT